MDVISSCFGFDHELGFVEIFVLQETNSKRLRAPQVRIYIYSRIAFGDSNVIHDGRQAGLPWLVADRYNRSAAVHGDHACRLPSNPLPAGDSQFRPGSLSVEIIVTMIRKNSSIAIQSAHDDEAIQTSRRREWPDRDAGPERRSTQPFLSPVIPVQHGRAVQHHWCPPTMVTTTSK